MEGEVYSLKNRCYVLPQTKTFLFDAWHSGFVAVDCGVGFVSWTDYPLGFLLVLSPWSSNNDGEGDIVVVEVAVVVNAQEPLFVADDDVVATLAAGQLLCKLFFEKGLGHH